MLYDKRWDKQTKSDPFTLESLIAWLEKQPAKKTYDYSNCQGACLLDQYITAVTGQPSTPTATHWKTCGGGDNYWLIAKSAPWTFGAALNRARAALPLSQRGET